MTEQGEFFNGNTLENVQLTLYVNGEEVQSEFGDIEFTDGGLEGPLGFMVSRRAVLALNNGQKVSVSIDLKPAVELEKLDADVHQKWQEVIEDERSKGQSFRRLFRIMLGKLMPWNLTLAFLDTNQKVSVDTRTISKAPGIGAKTAGKLVLELKDKIDIADVLPVKPAATPKAQKASQDVADATEALVALGYSQTQALKAVNGAKALGIEGTEELIKAALKQI